MKLVNLLQFWPLLLGAALGALLGYFGQCTSGTCPLTSTWWRGALYGALLGFLFSTTTGTTKKLEKNEQATVPEDQTQSLER